MKWYWKLLIALLFLLSIGFFSIDYFATRIVENEVEKLKTQVDGDYKFDYKSLDLSLINRTIVLRDFEFFTIVDSSHRTNKYDFKIDKLYLKYAAYRDIIFNRSVDIVEVVLRKPEISFGLRSHKKTSDNGIGKEQTDSLKSSFFEAVILEKFRIENGKVDFYDLKKPDKKLIYVNDLDVNVNGFVIDMVKDSFYIAGSNEKPLFSFKEIYKSDLKKHDLGIDEIQYFFNTKDLVITNFQFENKETPETFRKSLTYRSPWFSIKVPSITVNVNLREIYDSGILHLPKIEIADADVLIDNDLNFPIKPGHKPLPGRQITSIGLDFLIDSIVISNTNLKYIHKGEAAEAGFLKFSKLNALALRVTDIDTLITANPFMDLRVNSKFWDEGNLNVNFRIDLSSSVDRINVAGSLKNMPFKKAENMVKPLFGVEVKSGHIDQMVFSFAMDENMGNGKMVFDYKDLTLDVKKADKEQKKAKEETKYTEKSVGILNFMVNEAVRGNNLPGDKKYVSEGIIMVDRIKYKPVFDLLWISIANGLMDIALKDAFFDSKKNYAKKVKKQKKEIKKKESKDKKFSVKGLFNNNKKD